MKNAIKVTQKQYWYIMDVLRGSCMGRFDHTGWYIKPVVPCMKKHVLNYLKQN